MGSKKICFSASVASPYPYKSVVSHGPLVIQTGNLTMACDEKGYWPLWDAAPKGNFGSVSAAGESPSLVLAN
jgi:hypothetical protein